MVKDHFSVVDKRLFLRELESLKNLERAQVDKRYHKSNREHWGISVPDCAKLARAFSKGLEEPALLLFAKELWDTNLFDPMVCATKILTLPRVGPSQALWDLILYFLREVDGWALEDLLAHAAWKCILADESLLNEIEIWTKHPNLWLRRAALVYTLPYAKPGRDPERMLGWASCYSTDPEWFIQKSIGWWLRVLGENNPERVVFFLKSHWSELKGVARKEAMRKLSAKWQELIP